MENATESYNAFMTHHGLKVRLNPDYCNQFIKQETVLSWYASIEAFDSLRGILSIITAIIMILTHQNLVYTAVMIGIVYFIGFIISQSYFCMAALNLIYGLFYMIYAVIERLFIQYIALIVISIMAKELYILLLFVGVRLVCFVVMNIINII